MRTDGGVEGKGAGAEVTSGAVEGRQVREVDVVLVGDGLEGVEGDIVRAGEASDGGGLHVDGGCRVAGVETLLFCRAGDVRGADKDSGSAEATEAGWGEPLAGVAVDDERGFDQRGDVVGGIAGAGEADAPKRANRAVGESGGDGLRDAVRAHAGGEEEHALAGDLGLLQQKALGLADGGGAQRAGERSELPRQGGDDGDGRRRCGAHAAGCEAGCGSRSGGAGA